MQDKAQISGAAFKAQPRAAKEQQVREWARQLCAVDPTTTANGYARAGAEYFDAPFNTMRGLLHSAFEAHERPWLVVPGYDSPEVVEAVQSALAPEPKPEPQPEPKPEPQPFFPAQPPALDDLDRFVEDDVKPPKRKRGGQVGSKRPKPYDFVDGRFVATVDGPLHTCPRCATPAHTHEDIIEKFGARIERRGKPGERASFQSLCRKCKTAHRRELRHRAKDAAKGERAEDIAGRRARKNAAVYGDAPPPNTRPPQPEA